MKQTRRMINWMVACTVTAMLITSVSAKERTGTVVRLKGAARVSTGNNVWLPLKVGDKLKSGALVQTAASSRVDVVLGEIDLSQRRTVTGAATSGPAAPGAATYFQPKAEQDLVSIQADTLLAFDKMSVTDTGADEVTETQLDLQSGKIFGTVRKLSASSRYEIKLPNGVAGIRGTIYTVTSDGVLQVLSGVVVLSWVAPDGTQMTQTVSAGYQFDPHTGQVTAISEAAMGELLKTANLVRLGAVVPPRSFVGDQTIYFVSPTQGDNGIPGTN